MIVVILISLLLQLDVIAKLVAQAFDTTPEEVKSLAADIAMVALGFTLIYVGLGVLSGIAFIGVGLALVGLGLVAWKAIQFYNAQNVGNRLG
jgi:hypothetical protein